MTRSEWYWVQEAHAHRFRTRRNHKVWQACRDHNCPVVVLVTPAVYDDYHAFARELDIIDPHDALDPSLRYSSVDGEGGDWRGRP
jgi:hypothetical protein